jgi:hypothetical protein
MTKYLSSTPFTTGAPPGQVYRDNWEATFGKKRETTAGNNNHPGSSGTYGSPETQVKSMPNVCQRCVCACDCCLDRVRSEQLCGEVFDSGSGVVETCGMPKGHK